MFIGDDLPELSTNLVTALTALNVYDFSLGNSACHVCGQKSRPMSDDEYRRVMRERVQATPPTTGDVLV